MGRSSMVGLWCVALTIAATGCGKTLKGEATQPNPLAYPNETLRISEEIVITTGDMELYAPRAPSSNGLTTAGSLMVMDRYPLKNKASFTVVTRDRLRFHVQLEHKWKEYVDVRNWRAYIVDDKGHRYEPVDIDQSRESLVVQMWDYERRTAQRNQFGDIVAVNNDRYKNRSTLGSLAVHRGYGDYVFYSEDMFSEDVKALTFVLERRGFKLKFTWKFSDEDIARSCCANRPTGAESKCYCVGGAAPAR
jgi:hypothetical protein